MKPLIYSVEDDSNIQHIIKIALENSNFIVEIFSSAKDMFAKLKTEKPQLFILDIMLPDMDGLEIVKTIKKNSTYHQTPILILSAKSSEIDKVIGIDIGADDYLSKPFGVLELVARVKALLRRNQPKETILEHNELLVDEQNHTITYRSNPIDFTNKQFELFVYLIKNHNRLVSRDELLNQIWGYDYIGETRTLDVHIKEIRRKLKLIGLHQPIIETVRSKGYRFIYEKKD